MQYLDAVLLLVQTGLDGEQPLMWDFDIRQGFDMQSCLESRLYAHLNSSEL